MSNNRTAWPSDAEQHAVGSINSGSNGKMSRRESSLMDMRGQTWFLIDKIHLFLNLKSFDPSLSGGMQKAICRSRIFQKESVLMF